MKVSDLISEYEHTFIPHVTQKLPYLSIVRTFFKLHFDSGRSILPQLTAFKLLKQHETRTYKPAAVSHIRSFIKFIEKKGSEIQLENDLLPSHRMLSLDPKARPMGIIINRFMKEQEPTLATSSKKIYTDVLNKYAKSILYDCNMISRESVENFVLPEFASKTRKYYSVILKKFAQWLLYKSYEPETIDDREFADILANRVDTSKVLTILQIEPIKVIDRQAFEQTPGLTIQERNRIYSTIRRPDIRLIYVLMAWNGLRCSEALRLRETDIAIQDEMITIEDSNKKRITLPLFRAAKKEIQKYLPYWETVKDKSTLLFPKVTYDFASQQINKAIFGAGIAKVGNSLSVLRATSGRILYESGVPLEYIQSYLRYRNPARIFMFAQDINAEKTMTKLKQYSDVLS